MAHEKGAHAHERPLDFAVRRAERVGQSRSSQRATELTLLVAIVPSPTKRRTFPLICGKSSEASDRLGPDVDREAEGPAAWSDPGGTRPRGTQREPRQDQGLPRAVRVDQRGTTTSAARRQDREGLACVPSASTRRRSAPPRATKDAIAVPPEPARSATRKHALSIAHGSRARRADVPGVDSRGRAAALVTQVGGPVGTLPGSARWSAFDLRCRSYARFLPFDADAA